MTAAQAWNANILDLIAAAKAHCHVVILTTFVRGVEKVADSSIRAALRRMASLFALHHIAAGSGDLLRFGFLTPAQVRSPPWSRHRVMSLIHVWHVLCVQADMVDTATRQLLVAIRPDAVGLVDGLAIHDYELASAIGRHDGDVYNALFEAANSKHNAMNKSVEGIAWESVYKPLLTGKSRL